MILFPTKFGIDSHWGLWSVVKILFHAALKVFTEALEFGILDANLIHTFFTE